MSLFISNAVAASTAGDAANMAGGPNSTASIVMMVGLIVIFYFLMWRPQSKRAKEHRDLIGNLKKGDEIVTSGGVLGKIVNLNEKFLEMAIADGVEIKLQRSSVTNVLPKGTMKSTS